jgi:hypothetical protein
MSDFGIKVTRPGKGVSSTDIRDFTIHSDYNILKIAEEGSGTASLNNDWATTINHGLGYKPIVFFNFEHPGISRWIMAPGGADHFTTGGSTTYRVTGWFINTNVNNVTLNLEYDPVLGPAGPLSVKYKYYIMIEPREDAWYD